MPILFLYTWDARSREVLSISGFTSRQKRKKKHLRGAAILLSRNHKTASFSKYFTPSPFSQCRHLKLGPQCFSLYYAYEYHFIWPGSLYRAFSVSVSLSLSVSLSHCPSLALKKGLIWNFCLLGCGPMPLGHVQMWDLGTKPIRGELTQKPLREKCKVLTLCSVASLLYQFQRTCIPWRWVGGDTNSFMAKWITGLFIYFKLT